MLKKNIAFLFFGILLLSLVSSQASLGETEKSLKEATKSAEESVEKIRGFTEADKWNFIGLQWKEFLLKNKLIAGMDAFFTKINIVFVILFGMDWRFSMQILFAFLFWCFTLFSVNKYIFSVTNNNISLIYSFVPVILLAQINLFEYVGKWSVALVFYKDSILWKTLLFLFIIAIFVVFGLLNSSISKLLKKKKEKKEKGEEKETIKTLSGMIDAAIDAGGSKNN